VAELERSREDYRRAAARFEAIGRDLLGALGAHADWTSSATHAVLPLLATDTGIALQVESGIAASRRRFGEWAGGFWLPECAHAPWLDPLLAQAGVRASCVDLTDVLGAGAAEHLRPLRPQAGPVLLPVDRQTVELVWSDAGYPADGTYRDYHHHTVHHHRPWGNDGRPYDRGAALALAREHAADFVTRTRERIETGAKALGRPALCVCALDTELLGHWWHEGVAWLEAVLDEAEAQGLPLTRLDSALDEHPPAALEYELPVTTWGAPRDLSTWSGPAVGDFAWRARAAELRVVAASPDVAPRAVRELLALQSSDWAFMVTRGLAGDYPRERAEEHAAALDAALGPVASAPPELRALAPDLAPAGLLR
jgi:1,4-alpha-glucan branching enzyme